MSKSDLGLRRVSPAVQRYGLSILSVAICTAVTFPLQEFGVRVSLFFPAVLLATWFGGTGPGLLAVLLSILSINFFFTEPFFAFEFSVRDIPTTVAFLFSALVISSWSSARKRNENRLRKSESELRQARNELEGKVEERTAKLSRANEELHREIIERENAEQKLRHSEAFLTEGQRISHTGSWSWDVSSGKATWSEEHYRIFGFAPERTEPSFQLFIETVHPDDRQFVKQELDEAIHERIGFDLEFRLALADGSIKHVQGVGRPVLGPSGEVDSFTGTTVDISERKRGEALFAGEKRLLEMIATGVALERYPECPVSDYRRLPSRHARFCFVASSRWSSSGFRSRAESSQRMEAGDGKAAHWTVCRLLRDGGVSRITGHSLRYCDRSTLGRPGASCCSIKSWAASLLVESSIVVGRKSPGNLLYLRARNAKSESARPRGHREGDVPGTSCD